MEKYYKVDDVKEIIKKLARERGYFYDDDTWYTGVCAVDGALACLDTVEFEEPKQATKGLHLGHQYYCSNCGVLTYMHNYCASCGAKVIKETLTNE